MIAIILLVKLNGGIVVCTYKFCLNLYRLVLSHQEKGQESSLDEQQVRLLNTATRQTLLGIMMGIAITFGMAAVALNVFLSINIPGSIYNRLPVIWALSLLFMGFTTSIYLGFKVNQKYYDKCCGICHRRLENVCEYMAKGNGDKCTETDPEKGLSDLQVARVNSASTATNAGSVAV